MQVLIALLSLKNRSVRMTLCYSTCYLCLTESYLLPLVTRTCILLPLTMVSQHRESNIKFVAYFALFFLINKIDTGEKNASSQSDDKGFTFWPWDHLPGFVWSEVLPAGRRRPSHKGGRWWRMPLPSQLTRRELFPGVCFSCDVCVA